MLEPYTEFFTTYLIHHPFIHGLTFFVLTLIQYYLGLAYMQAILTTKTPFQTKNTTTQQTTPKKIRIRLKPQAFIQAFIWGIILSLVGYALNILLASPTSTSILNQIKQFLHGILYGAIWGVTIPNIAISWVNLSIIKYVMKNPTEIDGQVQYSEIATLYSYRNHLLSMLLLLFPLFILTLNAFVIGVTIGVTIYILDLSITIQQKRKHKTTTSKPT